MWGPISPSGSRLRWPLCTAQIRRSRATKSTGRPPQATGNHTGTNHHAADFNSAMTLLQQLEAALAAQVKTPPVADEIRPFLSAGSTKPTGDRHYPAIESDLNYERNNQSESDIRFLLGLREDAGGSGFTKATAAATKAVSTEAKSVGQSGCRSANRCWSEAKASEANYCCI